MSGNILTASGAVIPQRPVYQSADIVKVAAPAWGTASNVGANPAAVTSVDEHTVNQTIEAAHNTLEKKQALLHKLLANSDGKGRYGPGDLEAAWADSELAVHGLTNILLAAPSLSPLPEVSKAGSAASRMSALKTSFNAAMAPVQYHQSAPLAAASATDRDFLLGISHAIGEFNENYVKVHERAVSENLTFYEDFSNIYKDLATYLDPKDKGTILLLRSGSSIQGEDGKVDYKLPGLLDVLEALEKKYNSKQNVNGVLVADQTEESAREWAKDLGMPDTTVTQTNGRWRVMVDISPITEMIASLNKQGTDGSHPYSLPLPPAVFNAWKVGLEGNEAKIKNTSSMLASKLATANSRFESVVKILSSTYSAFLEMWKGFLS